ncbi:Gamma-aminobutyric acid type B receptor subunit 1-like [Oopsacas minuta]|uniref:Gamma-aminobutyric acid type B receptor subunit 1-like n=1 Tax=Oopsacas minuta TaxID=111878 RepID=A0AAV7JLZ5_9METZ|nr:Gamma-aminobutyric acid type B receptor subunit 1-like [Oopsacas minuta]
MNERTCLKVTICKRRLDVLGLYPRSGDGWTGPFVTYTAELALKHINENTNLLNDYQIVIDWKNTQCDGGIALKQFIDALGKNQNQTYLAVLGAGCSVATSQVAVISYRYGLAQITFASTAPNLGNNVMYPRFVRGVPSDLKVVHARARFLQQNNWKRVAIINEQDPTFVSSSHHMENVLSLLNVDYKVEDITLDGTVPLEQQVSILANNLRGYRIIIANMYEDAAIKLFCYLYKQKEKYLLPNIATWLFLGWFTDQWHDKQGVLEEVGCTAEQIATASNGALGFLATHSKKHFMGQTNNNQVTIANRTTAELFQEYKELILERINNDTVRFDREFDVYDAYVYDSIWTLALAMQNASDKGFNLTEISQKQNLEDTNIFSKNSEFSSAVYNGMLYQNFIGWTGNVRFSGHERFYPQVQILEFVDGNLVYRGDCENIPYFDDFTEDSINSIMCSLDETFTYWNKETATDGINNMYTSGAIVALVFLLSLCIGAYVTFLIIVILVGKWEKLESIYESSPIITCIILAGNYFLLIAGVLYVFTDRFVGHENPLLMSSSFESFTTEMCGTSGCKFLCMLPVIFALLGSSLIFGGMIGKASTIYLYAIKNSLKHYLKILFLISNCLPVFFICVDIILVIIWGSVSFLVVKSEVLPTGIDNEPYIRVLQCGMSTQQETATSIFIVFLIIYKIMIIVIGLVMAYFLRDIKKKDLRYWDTITWTMYTMSISTFVLFLFLFLIEDFNAKHAVICVLVLVTVTTSASITGLPPVYYIFKYPHPGYEAIIIPKGLRNTEPKDILMKHQIINLESDNAQLNCDVEDLKNENKFLKQRKGVLEENKSQSNMDTPDIN